MFGKKKTQHSLEQLIKGINHALNAADDLSDDHYKKFFEQYFIYIKEDNLYIPKVMNIKIDENYILPVPIISLVDVKELGIDEGEIEFTVDANGLIKDTHHEDSDIPQISVEISPSKHSEKMKFKIKFKQIHTSEGFLRIQDAFNSTLSPIQIDEDKDNA